MNRVPITTGQGRYTYHAALGEHQRVLNELSLRGEVETVVQKLGPVVSDELVAERADFAVHNEGLSVQVSKSEDGHSGGVVAATALQTNETVLDSGQYITQPSKSPS